MRELRVGSGRQAYVISRNKICEVMLVPTSEQCRIFQEPAFCGVGYQRALAASVLDAMQVVCEPTSRTMLSTIVKQHPINVVQILRGGLSFALDRALFDITATAPAVSFLSSQRTFGPSGTPEVESTEYQKWCIQDKAILATADIAATGTTLTGVLDKACAQYALENKRISYLVLLVIGTPYVQQVLDNFAERITAQFGSEFKGATLIYLERLFALNDQVDPTLVGHKWGIDFFRRRSPACPYAERRAHQTLTLFVERCAIYDGGIRAFNPDLHLEGLRVYWRELAERASDGLMSRLLQAKTDLLDYLQPQGEWLGQRPWWQALDEATLAETYVSGRQCAQLLLRSDLRQLCAERLLDLS